MAIFRGTGGAGDANNDITINQVTELTQDAEQAATEAASSATSAASSASSASTSATNAATSATSASNSATASANSATTASNAATAAQTAQTGAETAETNAETAQAAAETAQTAAEAAQTAAETAETNAATSETNAATSETNAATSETNAANSASAASTSETNAANSASAASTSATNASNAQTAAETARDQTLTAFDNFDDRYLGVKASDPTLDNDGDALVSGALYFNSTDGSMKVYDGSQWLDAYANGATFLVKSNNLSDLPSASTARTNLGLGTAATTDSTDYATAAQGALADTATQPGDLGTAAALDVGTGANNVVQLDGSGALPAVDGSNLTNVSTVANLGDLTDVDTTGVTDGQVIVYNETSGNWETADQSASGGTFTTYNYTATSGQTVFTGADDNTNSLLIDNTNNILVTLNGITLENGTDYTATSSAVTLTSGATTDDELNIYAFGSFDVANYTQFPFFKSSGAAANIDLTGFNSIRFFKADGTASNIALG